MPDVMAYNLVVHQTPDTRIAVATSSSESQIEKIDRLARSAGLTRSAFLVRSAIQSRRAKEKKYKRKKALA